jgi:uncharacterized protein YjbJ (UPF0337 family)
MGETTDKVSGRAKQAAGDIAGDDDLKAEGEVEEGSADAKGKIREVTDTVKGKLDEAVDTVKDKLKKD